MLKYARTQARLSQEQRSQTSSTAVSAYEHGRKSPSLETLERLLGAAGFELDVHPRVEFSRAAGLKGA